MPAAPVRAGSAVFMKHDKMSLPRGNADSPHHGICSDTDCPRRLHLLAREQDVTTEKRTSANRTSFGVPLLGDDKVHVDETTIADWPKCSAQSGRFGSISHCGRQVRGEISAAVSGFS